MDLIFDFVVEIFADNLVDITLSVIPENKHNEKIERHICIFIFVITILFLILFVLGIGIITKTNSESIPGKIFICLTPIQLIASAVLYIIKKLTKK